MSRFLGLTVVQGGDTEGATIEYHGMMWVPYKASEGIPLKAGAVPPL